MLYEGLEGEMEGTKTRLKIFLIIFLCVMIFGTLGFMVVEKKSPIDAAYFVIVTMATVGYGDIHPLTQWGKVFTVILIVMGVGTFLGVVANMTEVFLARREVQSRLEKLNMVIGVFFSEVGLELMAKLSKYDPDFDTIRSELIVTGAWTDRDFDKAVRDSRAHTYSAALEDVHFPGLKEFLLEKRDFMVRLLENPALLEHQSFTDLLRAVFHLAEELSYRLCFQDMPDPDRNHLSGDIKRIYHLIVNEWLFYMRYLKKNYPFLFSLAIRTNPFDKTASPVFRNS